MNKFFVAPATFSLVSMLFLFGCEPDQPQDFIILDKGPFDFNRNYNELRSQLVQTDAFISEDRTLRVAVVNDSTLEDGDIYPLDCGCDYTTTDPDIIIRAGDGAWTAASTAANYVATLTRLSYPQGETGAQDGWRQLELSDSWAGALPEYSPSTQTTTLLAVTGHGREFSAYPAIWELMAKVMSDQSPDYVFALGDMIAGGQPDAQYSQLKTHFFDRLLRVDGSAIPHFLVPGNHEFV